MDLDEILERIKHISSDICDNLEPFCKSLDEITNTSLTAENHDEKLSMAQRGYLRNLFNKIEPSLQVTFENNRNLVKKNFEVLKEKQAEVKRLEDDIESLKTEYETKELKVKKMQRQCEHYKEKLKVTQNLKDCIKTYKLLTGTNFAYKKQRTTGYIKANNPLNFEVFDFDKSKMDEQKITKQLWTLLQKVSNEDCSNRTEHTRNNKKLILS